MLQVGHVERFNPALEGIREISESARYIESQRLAPFSFRSTDIGVVLDLMIHDLDLVLALVPSTIKSVEAFGGASVSVAPTYLADLANSSHHVLITFTYQKIIWRWEDGGVQAEDDLRQG